MVAGSVTCLPRQLPGSSARLEADAMASTRRGQARLRRLETLGCPVVPPTAWPHRPWQRRNAVSVPLTVTGAVTGPMAPAQGGCSLGAEFDRGIPLSDSGTTQGRSQRGRTAGRALEVSVAEGRAARGLGTVRRGAGSLGSGQRSLSGCPERARTPAFLRGHSGGWPRAIAAEVARARSGGRQLVAGGSRHYPAPPSYGHFTAQQDGVQVPGASDHRCRRVLAAERPGQGARFSLSVWPLGLLRISGYAAS